MPRRYQVTRKATLEYARKLAATPRRIRVRTTIGIAKRGASGGVVVAERIPDLDVLIAPSSGQRLIRALPEHMRGRDRFLDRVARNEDAYEAKARKADRTIDVELLCTEQALGLMTDVTSTIAVASGGARSTKTHVGSQWFFRQWLMRGGRGARAWMLAPELRLCFILVNKWCVGETGAPPVCPPDLVLSYPRNKGQAPLITMIDGTTIEVVHTKGEGENLPGFSVDWWQWTEAAATRHPKNFARARGRLVTSKGQGYVDAVPEARHWVRSAIIEPAEEDERAAAEAAAKGEDYEPRYRIVQLASKDNPWNDERETAAFLEDLQKIDPRLAEREAKGEWTGDANLVFDEVFDRSRHEFDLETFEVSRIPHHDLVDVTRVASVKWFYEPHDWIVAVDVNARPHTALIGKIAAPRNSDPRSAANWLAVFFDVLQVWNKDSYEAAGVLRQIHGGIFTGAGVIMDASSCVYGHNAGGGLNSKLGMVPMEAYQKQGFAVLPPARERGGAPKNPSRFHGTIVDRRLFREDKILIHAMRCRALSKALREQEDAGDGITPAKYSNTDHDRRISSCIEVLRYWTWPFFSLLATSGEAVNVKVRA